MDLRLQAQLAFDDRAVALPHGTEVVTRIERVDGARTVPQGSVGRVMRATDDQIDVAVVGIGTFRYRREELTPRRVGQALFAARRAAEWEQLGQCVVIETVVGSHAWGLANENSDIDRRGVFALPFTWTCGLVAPPEDLISADGSSSYWSVAKTIKQALRADPNTLEMLFVPGAKPKDVIGEWILGARQAFVSREIYGTFGRYALAQLKRLEQSNRLAEHRADVLDWLRADPSATLDSIATKLAKVSPRAAPTEADAHLQAKQYLKNLYQSMHDQGLLEGREFSALATFAREKSMHFDLPRHLRPKNAYNLLRLVALATSWLRDGFPTFQATGAFRDRLLAIKNGDVDLDDVLAEAREMTPALEEAKRMTKLPERPDIAEADEALRHASRSIALRWASNTEGPFGRESPEPPCAEWAEGAD